MAAVRLLVDVPQPKPIRRMTPRAPRRLLAREPTCSRHPRILLSANPVDISEIHLASVRPWSKRRFISIRREGARTHPSQSPSAIEHGDGLLGDEFAPRTYSADDETVSLGQGPDGNTEPNPHAGGVAVWSTHADFARPSLLTGYRDGFLRCRRSVVRVACLLERRASGFAPGPATMVLVRRGSVQGFRRCGQRATRAFRLLR